MATRGGAALVTEVHLTLALFVEARVGQEAHQKRLILRERHRCLYTTLMGKSKNAMSSVGLEGRGAHKE
jgi:hypothetical protein